MAGGSNTINLTAPTTSPYVLTAVNNTTSGANGLPVIAANDTRDVHRDVIVDVRRQPRKPREP